MTRWLSAPSWSAAKSGLLLAAAVFAAAFAAVWVTRDVSPIAAVWPVNAVIVAALMRATPRRRPFLLACAFAANVAANLQARGCEVLVCGVVGDDVAGRQLIAPQRPQVELPKTR